MGRISDTEVVYTVILRRRAAEWVDLWAVAALKVLADGMQVFCRSHLFIRNCKLLQAASKIGEGGDKAAMSAVDVAKQIADQAEPTADRINAKIEKEAHKLSANAEFHASDVADEYQKGVKVTHKQSPAAFLALFKTQQSALHYLETRPSGVSRCHSGVLGMIMKRRKCMMDLPMPC